MDAIANAILAVERWRLDVDVGEFLLYHLLINVIVVGVTFLIALLWAAVKFGNMAPDHEVFWRWRLLLIPALGVRYFPTVWKRLVRWASAPERVAEALHDH
jgi:hypothetical protein